jgi:hypothetical protein
MYEIGYRQQAFGVGYNQSGVQQPLYLAQSSNNYGLRLSFKFLNGFFIHIVRKLIDQRQDNLHILDFWVGDFTYQHVTAIVNVLFGYVAEDFIYLTPF